MKKFTYLSLLVVTVIFFSAGQAFAAVNDYTNYYAFDEGTGRSVGDAAGGQNGSLTGTSTGFGWASGMIGTALGMDGLSGESVALPDGFLRGSQGSIVLWLKLNTLTDRNIIFSGHSTTDNYIYAALQIDHEGRPQLVFRTTTDGVDQKVQGSKILNKNEWYQLVLTANSLTYRIFVNGEEISVAGNNTGRWIPDFTNRTLAYHIGSLDSNPLSGVFDGYLDDMRMYARALTQDDVTALYNGGSPGTPGTPLAAKQTAAPSDIAVTEVTLPSAPTSTQATAPVDPIAVLQAKIKELTDQLVLLKATTLGNNAAIAPFLNNLSVGTRADDVTRLQFILIGEGFLAQGLSTGYFGQLTKAAVIKFQTKHGLPATGFFGPMTRAKVETLSATGGASN